ncbi:hypothetical protein MSG28_010651 [Choristoneura fumiferana]|uniref:Uncharacterized protein n=2 Tax=Choristoneura fumiferana TaxID=7141 RepID=A0ACC0KNV2_CHOFU|nr:hypothetical protein MSG28_010651 [Choristoneura fumiferana]
MLEYIRKKCKLGTFTSFDLCDDSGALMGLFQLKTYAYATEQFEHKKTYYVIVLKTESDKRVSVLPQLNHENLLYLELKTKVKEYLEAGPESTSPPGKVPTPPGKVTPPGKITPPPAAKKGKK